MLLVYYTNDGMDKFLLESRSVSQFVFVVVECVVEVGHRPIYKHHITRITNLTERQRERGRGKIDVNEVKEEKEEGSNDQKK